jgi:hypothetical protein
MSSKFLIINLFDGIRRGPVIQRPCGAGWHSRDTSSNRCELYPLGAHWFHIQLCDTETTFQLVGEIQL